MNLRPLRFLVASGSLLLVLILLGLPAAELHAQRVPLEQPERELEKRRKEYDASRERPRDREFDEDVRGRHEWFLFQRRFPYDMIPAGARSAAVEQTKMMERKLEESRRRSRGSRSMLAAARWEEIGPMNIGGRITTVAADPARRGTLYIGAASGGVWKTTDNGGTWSTTFDTQSSLTVGAIAIDYTNPDVIYAGTGEPYTHSEEYFGDGIFKSTDGGATWSNIGLRNVGGFAKIFVHRQNHDIVYAVGAKENGGFYRSTDGGATWKRTLTLDGRDMSVNPANSNELYVAADRSVRYSNDGGLTFSNITAGITTSSITRISVALAPSQPSRVYALVSRNGENGEPDIGEIYASANRGLTWRLHATMDPFFFAYQGFYNNCLIVHPDSADVVLAGGIDLIRSSDGGHTWINYTETYLRMWDPTWVHADQHAVEFDPHDHNRLYLGNDGGLNVSPDAGINWSKISTRLPITQFYKMDVDQNDLNKVYGGSQDNGSSGAVGNGPDPKHWSMISGGDGFYVAVDPFRPGIVYSEVYYGSPIYRVDISSLSDPNMATPIDNDIQAQGGEGGDWSTPLVISHLDGRLYSGRRNLWRTSDGGITWKRLETGNGALMSAVGLGRVPGSEKSAIIGTVAGEIRYTTDDGRTWRTSSGTPRRTVSDLRYDPVVPGRIYATFSGFGSGHVYRSDNHGASFADITSNLPNAPVNTIAIDAADNSHLFIGTDAGAFVSLDGGKIWIPFNEGLPLAPVVDMKIHDASRTLVAATHGRSMHRIDISSVEGQPVMIRPLGGETYQAPGELSIGWFGFSGAVRVLLSYDGGQGYDTVIASTLETSALVNVPLVKTTVARVRIEEIATGRSVHSDDFSLLPKVNGSEQSMRGFIAEAIEVRNGYLWATVRDSDSLYKLRLPTLTGRQGLVRSGIPGRVRDLAYDPAIDRFYALVTGDDNGGARIFRMDTNGVGEAELPLPAELTHASGIAMTPSGLAVMTPGERGEIHLLDPSGAPISRSAPLQGSSDADRRALVWDDAGLVQGVLLADSAIWLPSQLQRISLSAAPTVEERTPVVLPTVSRLEFFGLAYDGSGTADQRVLIATDTAGAFYKFVRSGMSGVVDGGLHTRRAAALAITGVTPNPFRSETVVAFSLRSGRKVTLDLFREDGRRCARLFEGGMEAGSHELPILAEDLPSGVYYVVLSDGAGDRDVRTVVLMK